jgi:threonine/homoserine/homoserine lactone efflux protein
MPTSATLVTFAAATLVMLLVPGPSVLFVVTRSIQDGRAAGMLSVLGLETGAAIHAVATAGGLGAVLASTPWALSVVRYGGAAYLVFLGLRQVFSQPSQAATAAPAISRLRVFTDGILVDLLNPKTTLFFLAFLPQFVDPGRGSSSAQMLALGLCFVVLAVVTDLSYALLASALRHRLTRSPSNSRRLSRTTAGVYLGLGGLAAVA